MQTVKRATVLRLWRQESLIWLTGLYEYCISECERMVPGVQRGVFGADMKIELENDGPFTIVLDSDKL